MTPSEQGILHFVREREAIRRKKELGVPPPWTDDLILQNYRFCNVKRKDDRVSRWLLNQYYPVFAGAADIWLPAAIGRIINWPPTLGWLMEANVIPLNAEDFDKARFEEVIAALRTAGAKIYTGAYMVYPGSDKGGTFKKQKEQFITEGILLPMITDRLDNLRAAVMCGEVRHLVTVLSSCYGLSTFMAGQIAADLTYFHNGLTKARDLRTFAPMGPGSIRGLNRLLGRKLSATFNQSEFEARLIDILGLIEWNTDVYGLTLHDVQNVMCEMDKYWRVSRGEGVPRSRYKEETAYVV